MTNVWLLAHLSFSFKEASLVWLLILEKCHLYRPVRPERSRILWDDPFTLYTRGSGMTG